MKKLFKSSPVIALSLILILSLSACGSKGEEPQQKPAEIDQDVSKQEETAEDSQEEKSEEKKDPRLSNGIIDGVNFEELLEASPAQYKMAEYYERTQDPLEGTWEVGGVDAAFVQNVKRGQPHPTYSYDIKADENKIVKTFDLVASNGDINYLIDGAKILKGEIFDGDEAASWVKEHQEEDHSSTVIGDAKLILTQNAQGVKGSRSLFIQALEDDQAQ